MSRPNGESSSSANKILVVHDYELDPVPFLHRLIQTPGPSPSSDQKTNEDPEIAWTIDNKYYTAHVTFQPRVVEMVSRGNGVEVVLYLFEGDPPNPLPAALVKLITEEPRDIALAVRVSPGVTDPTDPAEEHVAGTSGGGGTLSWDEVEELFDELGMEVVDEQGEAEEDDERPIGPLESVRQTLMTHMWPEMVRKPLGVNVARHFTDDDEFEPGEPTLPVEEEEDEGVAFPVSFNPPGHPSIAAVPPVAATEEAFPSISELRAQMSLIDREEAEAGPSRSLDGLEGMDERQRSALERLEMLELDDELFGDLGESSGRGLGGPGEEEYARLDDWLDDEDNEGGEEGFVMLDKDESGNLSIPEIAIGQNDQPIGGEGTSGAHRAEPGEGGEEGFEDDFAAFQSAPPTSRGAGAGGQLPLDPTPLLLHLQAVRAELMGVEDPDERRKRAGKEVEMIMRGLGMDAGLGLDDLDDV